MKLAALVLLASLSACTSVVHEAETFEAPSAGAQSLPSAGASSTPSAGADAGGAPSTTSAGASSGGAPGADPGGAPSAGADPGGAPSAGADPGGAPSAGADPGGAPSAGAPSAGAGGADTIDCPLSPELPSSASWRIYTVPAGLCLTAGRKAATVDQLCFDSKPDDGACAVHCTNYLTSMVGSNSGPLRIAILAIDDAVTIGECSTP